mgnify:CR=1 FL=1
MIETWEAAADYVALHDATSSQHIEIATLLGWTQARSGGGGQTNRNETQVDGR